MIYLSPIGTKARDLSSGDFGGRLPTGLSIHQLALFPQNMLVVFSRDWAVKQLVKISGQEL